jgi:hypothetical protein
MAKLIRRTLTITIHEQWTFVWIPGQTNDSQGVEEENTTLLAPAELAQQLSKLLGLSPQTANQPDSPIQIFVQSLAKESTDENTNP